MSSQPSLKVPVPDTCRGLPQSTPTMARRRRRWERARSVGLRRSSTRERAEAEKARRRRLAVARMSASRGTMGTPSGTAPRVWPTTTSRVTSSARAVLPSHSTDQVASPTSSRPGMGRPRRAASASARRAASMTWAEEAGRSCSRRERATNVSQRTTGSSGAVNRWWYQPGEVTPAP